MNNDTQHIIIQGATDSTLTLNVNGEAQEIRNELGEIQKQSGRFLWKNG